MDFTCGVPQRSILGTVPSKMCMCAIAHPLHKSLIPAHNIIFILNSVSDRWLKTGVDRYECPVHKAVQIKGSVLLHSVFSVSLVTRAVNTPKHWRCRWTCFLLPEWASRTTCWNACKLWCSNEQRTFTWEQWREGRSFPKVHLFFFWFKSYTRTNNNNLFFLCVILYLAMYNYHTICAGYTQQQLYLDQLMCIKSKQDANEPINLDEVYNHRRSEKDRRQNQFKLKLSNSKLALIYQEISFMEDNH